MRRCAQVIYVTATSTPVRTDQREVSIRQIVRRGEVINVPLRPNMTPMINKNVVHSDLYGIGRSGPRVTDCFKGRAAYAEKVKGGLQSAYRTVTGVATILPPLQSCHGLYGHRGGLRGGWGL